MLEQFIMQREWLKFIMITQYFFLNIKRKAPSILHEYAAIACLNVVDNPLDIRLWLGHGTINDTIRRLLICAIISERPKHLEDDPYLC